MTFCYKHRVSIYADYVSMIKSFLIRPFLSSPRLFLLQVQLIISVLFLTLLVLPIAAHAKPEAASKAEHSGDVRGRVQLCGSPLQRALVHLLGHSFAAQTDAQGKFYLHYVQPGSYKLLVEQNEQVLTSVDNVAVLKNKVTDLGVQNFCPDNDNDGFDAAGDCNDQNPNVFPGASESCDSIDNNCDGTVDEGCPTCTDADQDGFFAQASCGSVVDCDDQDESRNPAVAEVCGDGIDNNCDEQVDEDCLSCVPGASCETGSVGECAEGVYDLGCTCIALNTSSAEICDSLDNDCDGAVDQGNPGGGQSCNTGLAGVCAEGVGICNAGGLSCQQLKQAGAEVCDTLDNDCDGQVDEGNVCGTDPVDCQMSEWSPFTSCSAQCGGGTQTRVRSILVQPENGGAACGATFENVACNTQPCPIDCVVSEWSEFGECSALCAGGVQTRTRTVVVQPQFGGAECPALQEVQACNTQACELRYIWQTSAFGSCSVSCGGGVQTRTVQCLDTQTGGIVADSFCAAEQTKPATTQACNTQACTLGSFEQATLDAHNAVRAQVSAGTLGDEPQAEPDLVPMVWDNALAAAAQEWASNCSFGFNTAAERQQSYLANGGNLNQGTWIGVNLSFNSTVNANPAAAVNLWASEHENYTYATNSCSGVCGHYTQLVWDDSQRLGCARANCPVLSGLPSGGDYTVCYYYPGGNFNGQLPYQTQ